MIVNLVDNAIKYTPAGGLLDVKVYAMAGRATLEVNDNGIYHQTMGIEMRAGRHFSDQDSAEAPKVAIVNETIARRFFPNESPLGHRLLITGIPRTIVGVAQDTRHLRLDQETRLEVYLPYAQTLEWGSFFGYSVVDL